MKGKVSPMQIVTLLNHNTTQIDRCKTDLLLGVVGRGQHQTVVDAAVARGDGQDRGRLVQTQHAARVHPVVVLRARQHHQRAQHRQSQGPGHTHTLFILVLIGGVKGLDTHTHTLFISTLRCSISDFKVWILAASKAWTHTRFSFLNFDAQFRGEAAQTGFLLKIKDKIP